jgi:hypothetical protein
MKGESCQKMKNLFQFICRFYQATPEVSVHPWMGVKYAPRGKGPLLAPPFFQSVFTIDILVNLDGEYCQVKCSMFGEKENKKLKALDVKNKL